MEVEEQDTEILIVKLIVDMADKVERAAKVELIRTMEIAPPEVVPVVKLIRTMEKAPPENMEKFKIANPP